MMPPHHYRHCSSKLTLLFQLPLRSPLNWTSTVRSCRKPPIYAKTEMPAKSSNKKPYGYWKHLPNVLYELEMYMSSLTPRPSTMPTAHELSLAERHDLAGAIRRHTWQKVAAAANLPLSSHIRPRSLNLSFCTKIHTRRLRPYMYWRDWNNVKTEIRQFIHQRGENVNGSLKDGELVMPTMAELVAHGRSDLKRAISLHGGVREVAKRLGLVSKSSSVEYWNEERVVEELKEVMHRTGKKGDFPAVEDMRQFGERGLLPAVKRLGGTRAFAQRMGLNVRRKGLRGSDKS